MSSSNSEIISKILECDKELLHKDISELLTEKMRDFTETLKKSTEKMIEDASLGEASASSKRRQDKMSKYYNGDLSHLEDEIFSMKKDEANYEYIKKSFYFSNLEDKTIYSIRCATYTIEEKAKAQKYFTEQFKNDRFFRKSSGPYNRTFSDETEGYDYLFTKEIIFIKKIINYRSSSREEYSWFENKLPLHINYLIKSSDCFKFAQEDLKKFIKLYEEKPYLFCGNSLEFEKTIIEEKSNLAKEREEFEQYKKTYLEDLEKQKKEFEEQKEQLRIQKEELDKREDELNHYKIKIERERNTLELEKKNYEDKLEQLKRFTEIQEEFSKEKIRFIDYIHKEQETIKKKTEKINNANLKLDEYREKLKLIKLSLDTLKSELENDSKIKLKEELEKLKLVEVSLKKQREMLEKEQEEFKTEKKEFEKLKVKEINLDEFFKDTNKSVVDLEDEEDVKEVISIIIDGELYQMDEDGTVYYDDGTPVGAYNFKEKKWIKKYSN